MAAMTKSKELIKPRALRHGDRVGLVAPASRPASAAVVARAERVISEMGFVPVVGKSVLNMHGFLAGSDRDRADDLNAFINDDSIGAIYALTGGYGALHLLPRLDYAKLAASPKIIVGGDEVTSLLNAIHARLNMAVMYAPNLDQIKSQETFEAVRFALTHEGKPEVLQAIGGQKESFSVDSDFYCAVEGVVEGRLIGGNLTAFASLLGTEYEPDSHNAIMFLDDVNEQNGILDRWFTSLYLGGHLQYASGIAFGAFTNCGAKGNASMMSLEDLFSERLKYLSKPACFGMPFGALGKSRPMFIGASARLHTATGTLEYLENALG